jgi:type II secretory pathway pseudopilin PulG
VVLIAILAAVTVPQLNEVNRRNKLSEMTSLFQRTVAGARALAMKNRQAVVIEVRNDSMWVNLLAGTACNSPARQRCFDLAENDGVDPTVAAANPGQGVVYLKTPEYTDAGVDMCSFRIAAIDTSAGACVVETGYSATGAALCYNGSGQLWIRAGSGTIDANAVCNATAPLNPDANWRRACSPWVGAGGTPSSTQTDWFSGADVRFNRFTAGTGNCPPGAASVAPVGAEDVTRRIVIPAGGHPYVKLTTANE